MPFFRANRLSIKSSLLAARNINRDVCSPAFNERWMDGFTKHGHTLRQIQNPLLLFPNKSLMKRPALEKRLLLLCAHLPPTLLHASFRGVRFQCNLSVILWLNTPFHNGVETAGSRDAREACGFKNIWTVWLRWRSCGAPHGGAYKTPVAVGLWHKLAQSSLLPSQSIIHPGAAPAQLLSRVTSLLHWLEWIVSTQLRSLLSGYSAAHHVCVCVTFNTAGYYLFTTDFHSEQDLQLQCWGV